jgi:hypothetical protein
LLDLDRVDSLTPNDACNLKLRGDVKRALQNYEETLLDLDKTNILKPNDASIWVIRGQMKLE